MLSSFTTGTVFGLSAGLAPGPLLMLIITQTLKHNTHEGIKVALAPLITDIPIILLAFVFIQYLSEFKLILGMVALLGSFYVLFLAYESLRIQPFTVKSSADAPRSIKKGALVNAMNPHPYLFWLTVGTPFMVASYAENRLAPAVFIICFYICLVGSKVLLAWLVGKSSRFLTGKGYVTVMRLLGILLGWFAIMLFGDACRLLAG
jgi:threonine/homoserine/homoserine lactone efflux protein